MNNFINTHKFIDISILIAMSDDEIVSYLSSNINEEQIEKITAMHNNKKNLFMAIKDSNVEKVRHLIKSGIDINCYNASKETPLFYACLLQNENMTKELISLGADVNFPSLFGETPLMRATLMGYDNIKNILIESNADPKIKDVFGNTANSIFMKTVN